MKRKSAKELLVDSFRELAMTRSFDKISTHDITGNCGYSTATFYRQFRDKYDLVAWAYCQDTEQIFNTSENSNRSIKEILISAAKYYYNHKAYFANLLLNVRGFESFMLNMTEVNYKKMLEILKSAGKEENLDRYTEMLVRQYVIGMVGFICEWIVDKQKADLDELISVFLDTFPYKLNKYLTT